jgi:predicted AlkP superfamily pyrophosphatase or phosphodiesterase
MSKLALILAVVCLGAGCTAARTIAPIPPDPAPRLVLISLDGFRWDYLQRPAAKRLRELAARGVRAERLIPAFPTKTSPNHFTIITGLYPEHHGISANIMVDSVLGRFATGNNPAVRDGRWWNGEPLWVTAERQGVRSAIYFWPGSEAEISGYRPHRYFAFNERTSRAARVDTVLHWLALPADSAPQLIAVYFSDVDTEGHNFGPRAAQTDSAIAHADSAVGAIIDGIARQGLRDKVNVVVVSDHGMAEVSGDRLIALDDLVSFDSLAVVDWSPVASIVPKPGRDAYVLRALRTAAHPHLTVYKKGELPARLHYNTGSRITPIIAIADEGWTITTRAIADTSNTRVTYGAHGYDNQLLSMGALFIGAGPGFRSGVTVPPFENVHLNPLMAHLLQLRGPQTDGSLDSVRAVLR